MQSTATPARSSQAASIAKYLSFALGKEEFGLEILKVREIVGVMDIVAVPCTPPYVLGVVNLRGQVIPVIDLRAKFDMEPAARTEQTCIIFVEISHNDRKLAAGIVVDRVSEVLAIRHDQIEEPPSFALTAEQQFILGMAKVGQSVKILLDIDRVLACDLIASLYKQHQ